MPLEENLDEEIKNVISVYKSICQDYKAVLEVKLPLMDEERKLEFLSKFLDLERITERAKRAKLEAELYDEIKGHLAHYIGLMIIERLNLNLRNTKIPRKAYRFLGSLIIDDNIGY